jgi:Haem-NO-binding
MKGIVFNLLEEVVTQEFGADTWDTMLQQSGQDGSYTSLGSYPDESLIALVMTASAMLKQEPNDVVRWFGVKAIPLFAKKYPEFFARHKQSRPFLLTINGIIHPEVRKLYPGASVPDFDLDTTSPEVLVLGYRSQRKLCAFAEGLIQGAAAHYGEQAEIAHPRCMHRGDDACRLELRFVPA